MSFTPCLRMNLRWQIMPAMHCSSCVMRGSCYQRLEVKNQRQGWMPLNRLNWIWPLGQVHMTFANFMLRIWHLLEMKVEIHLSSSCDEQL